jgi:hypothetical protein
MTAKKIKKIYNRDALEVLLKNKQMPADMQELIWNIAYRIRNAKNIKEAQKIADEIEHHFEQLDKIKNNSGIVD